MAKKDDKASKAKDKAKDKDKAKGKKGKGGDGGADSSPGTSIATHPRARGSVRRVKGWAGLAGFVIAAVLSLKASVPLLQVGERALAAGLVGYLLAWWFSVAIWRQLIIAEQRAAIEAIERRRAEDGDPKQAEPQPSRG